MCTIQLSGQESRNILHHYRKSCLTKHWDINGTINLISQHDHIYIMMKFPLVITQLIRDAGTGRCEGKGGIFSWKGTFELIYTKRCLQNIGCWTSPNHVFYLLDDRGVRGFSARRLWYSWSSMTAFLAFSEMTAFLAFSEHFLTIRYFAKAIL
jgi:hypothetical protein